jgi:hypothetical protein
MNHEPHILFVNSHSEGYSSDNDLDFIFHPSTLDFLSLAVWQLSMVEIASNLVVAFKSFRKFFAVFSAYTVDDA